MEADRPEAGADAPEVTTTATVLAGLVGQVAAQHGVAGTFAPDNSLVDRGLDPAAMAELRSLVEATFDLTITEHEVTPANFHSVASLTRLVERS